jgi:hypothetical protein
LTISITPAGRRGHGRGHAQQRNDEQHDERDGDTRPADVTRRDRREEPPVEAKAKAHPVPFDRPPERAQAHRQPISVQPELTPLAPRRLVKERDEPDLTGRAQLRRGSDGGHHASVTPTAGSKVVP